MLATQSAKSPKNWRRVGSVAGRRGEMDGSSPAKVAGRRKSGALGNRVEVVWPHDMFFVFCVFVFWTASVGCVFVFSCFRHGEATVTSVTPVFLCFGLCSSAAGRHTGAAGDEKNLASKPFFFRKLHRRSGDVHDICMCMCMCMYTYTEPNQIRF